MQIIADLTRANPGTALSVISRIPKLGSNEFQVHAVIHPRQAAEIVSVPSIQTTEVSETSDVGSQVALTISNLLASIPEERFTVLSFSSYILAYGAKLDPANIGRVTFLPWGFAWKIGGSDLGGTLDAKPLGSWPLLNISETEALQLLDKVLRKIAAFSETKSVRKTEIRNLLAAEDARLSKTQTGQITGFISILLNRAESAGLIAKNRLGKNPSIWHTAPPPQPTAAERDISKTKRGDLYSAALKEDGMGPFPNFRDELFDGIEKVVALECKPTLQNLINSAVAEVQKANMESHNGFAWGAVKRFLTELLRLQEVSLDDSRKPIRPGFLSMNTKVHSLATDWRDRLDGELILHLLKKGHEISFYDLPELCGAIYKTRDDPYDVRLNRVISYLNSKGLIMFDDAAEVLKLTGQVCSA